MNLNAYLPDYISDPELKAILDAISISMEQLWEARNSLFAQAHPQTATWSLDAWEQMVGITSGTAIPEQQRREAIIAKLRSRRTATVEWIKTIVMSYSNGEVELIEDFSTSTITILFVGQLGVPQWLDAVIADINAAMPAHLQVKYSRRYLLISEVSVMTLDEMNTTPMSYFAGGE